MARLCPCEGLVLEGQRHTGQHSIPRQSPPGDGAVPRLLLGKLAAACDMSHSRTKRSGCLHLESQIRMCFRVMGLWLRLPQPRRSVEIGCKCAQPNLEHHLTAVQRQRRCRSLECAFFLNFTCLAASHHNTPVSHQHSGAPVGMGSQRGVMEQCERPFSAPTIPPGAPAACGPRGCSEPGTAGSPPPGMGSAALWAQPPRPGVKL